MKKTTPRVEDAQMVETLEKLGIAGNILFDPRHIGGPFTSALNTGANRGRARVQSVRTISDRDFGGSWRGFQVGGFGADYLRRAATARLAVASLPHEEATTASARVDAAGELLQGGRRYVIRFAPGQLPPVNAFWSITMYQANGQFVQNAVNRHAVRDRDGLKRAGDGSLEISIRPDARAAAESNWLPSPLSGTFWLALRMYWPKEQILNGSWKGPRIARIPD
jgi:hypothetical protein